MRRNRLKAMFREGTTILNGWLSIDNGYSAEVMAHQGFDSLTVDLQHGLHDYTTAAPLLTAISTTATMPMARAPWNDQGIINKLLDAGAYGIICPMIDTPDDAARFVRACRYPPLGQRSFGPARAVLYGGADYPQHANEEILCLGMIETAGAIEHLDAILATEGLDGVYIGPADLALALGRAPGFDPSDPHVLETIRMIGSKAVERGLLAGIHCGSVEWAKARITDGFGLVTVSSDARFIAEGAKRVVTAMRQDSQATAKASLY